MLSYLETADYSIREEMVLVSFYFPLQSAVTAFTIAQYARGRSIALLKLFYVLVCTQHCLPVVKIVLSSFEEYFMFVV